MLYSFSHRLILSSASDKGKNEGKTQVQQHRRERSKYENNFCRCGYCRRKTTVVNELKKRLRNSRSLHFDNYTFEGEVENFYQWILDGANYNVWNLNPLEDDILEIKSAGTCDYLILDYPFAYCHDTIKPYIDTAFFVDTPLDISLARRILRDMSDATADEIRRDLEMYLKYARIAFVQMQKDILPSSDYVIDGTLSVEEIVNAIVAKMD